MKRFLHLAIPVAALMSLAGAPLHAAFVLNFDENCNGTVSVNGGPFVAARCTVAPDPTPGGVAGDVVTYFLPELVNTGDVGILEFGSLTQLSDVLSFTNVDGVLSGAQVGDRMIFYSLAGGTDLADTGFPSIAISFDVATEDVNGNFTWSPFPNTYNGLSPEATPEPAPLTLLGAGIAGLFFAKRKRA